MVENKYDGPSLDHTWNSGPWADPDGETVSGTSDDDMHTETTDLLPDGVDPADLTDIQRGVLERRAINPDETFRDTADVVGCSSTTVIRTLKRYTDYTASEDNISVKPRSEMSFDDLNDTQQRAIDMVIADNGMSQEEISRQLGKSKKYTSKTKNRYTEILEARRAELAADDDCGSESTAYDAASDTARPERDFGAGLFAASATDDSEDDPRQEDDMEQITVRVPEDTLQELDEAAEESWRTRAELIRDELMSREDASEVERLQGEVNGLSEEIERVRREKRLILEQRDENAQLVNSMVKALIARARGWIAR